ncbi:MAG: hypothetical protein JXR95_04095 [Deltaproteobacteria bacterium]|nr:hypothetical protein [Deltaproteobacteria bacterium]
MTINKQKSMLKIFYSVFLLQTLLIGMFPWLGLHSKVASQIKSDNRLIIYLFFTVALLEMLVVHFLRKYIFNPKIENLSDSESDEHEKNSTIQSREIITWAIASSSGIYGMVSLFLGGNIIDFYMLWGFAVLSLLYYSPLKNNLL